MQLLAWLPSLEMIAVTFNNISIFSRRYHSPTVKIFSLDDSCDAWELKVLSGEALTFSTALILSGFTVAVFHGVHL